MKNFTYGLLAGALLTLNACATRTESPPPNPENVVSPTDSGVSAAGQSNATAPPLKQVAPECVNSDHRAPGDACAPPANGAGSTAGASVAPPPHVSRSTESPSSTENATPPPPK